ncbi:MAG: hypothetical protein AB7E55_01370 [Pigmentiphaga sp.]
MLNVILGAIYGLLLKLVEHGLEIAGLIIVAYFMAKVTPLLTRWQQKAEADLAAAKTGLQRETAELHLATIARARSLLSTTVTALDENRAKYIREAIARAREAAKDGVIDEAEVQRLKSELRSLAMEAKNRLAAQLGAEGMAQLEGAVGDVEAFADAVIDEVVSDLKARAGLVGGIVLTKQAKN